MKVMIELDREDIHRELPYAVICEARYGSRWNTGKRRRRWMEEFTESEREAASKIFSKAHRMYLASGVPDSMIMSKKTLALWQKIGDFCASL